MRDTPCDAAVQTRVHLTEWIPFTVPTLINVIYPVNILIWLKCCSSLLSVSLKNLLQYNLTDYMCRGAVVKYPELQSYQAV